MATKAIKPVTRETSAFTRDRGLRPILVTIEHGLLKLRAKGLRSIEVVDVGWLYQHAVKARILGEKADKRAAKKAARHG